nr:L,D-transpeptidase family protein [Martelella sp. HB161492]
MPGAAHRALLRFGPLCFPAAIGVHGISCRKREGDGKTPLASMRLLDLMERPRRRRFPPSPLKRRLISGRDGWCDSPSDANYNRPVRLPFAPSHEQLLRDDGLYDVIGVLDWNVTARKRHAGSAIFLHLARSDFSGTQGCVAISRHAMRVILPHLSRRTKITILP